jgi:hypothetical protein
MDFDGDGCADEQEQQTAPGSQVGGGRRNPKVVWDFFDTPDGDNLRDRRITVADLVRVVERFGTFGDVTIDPLSEPPSAGYHTAFDRRLPGVGQDAWDSGMPNGSITVEDILALNAQFGHSCT